MINIEPIILIFLGCILLYLVAIVFLIHTTTQKLNRMTQRIEEMEIQYKIDHEEWEEL